jgi:hypothetical protein
VKQVMAPQVLDCGLRCSATRTICSALQRAQQDGKRWKRSARIRTKVDAEHDVRSAPSSAMLSSARHGRPSEGTGGRQGPRKWRKSRCAIGQNRAIGGICASSDSATLASACQSAHLSRHTGCHGRCHCVDIGQLGVPSAWRRRYWGSTPSPNKGPSAERADRRWAPSFVRRQQRVRGGQSQQRYLLYLLCIQ